MKGRIYFHEKKYFSSRKEIFSFMKEFRIRRFLRVRKTLDIFRLNRLCTDKKAVKHLECGENICNFANVQRNEGLLIVPHFSY